MAASDLQIKCLVRFSGFSLARLAIRVQHLLPNRLQPHWVVGATLAGPSGAGASAQDALAATDAYLAHVQQVVLRGMEDGLQVSELPLRAPAPFDGWCLLPPPPF